MVSKGLGRVGEVVEELGKWMKDPALFLMFAEGFQLGKRAGLPYLNIWSRRRSYTELAT